MRVRRRFTRIRIASVVMGVSVFILALVLAGCASFSPTQELPTLIPENILPTIIEKTAQALVKPTHTVERLEHTLTITSTATIVPTLTPSPPTETSKVEITPESEKTPQTTQDADDVGFEIPYAEIQIIRPGPMSKVVSPIDIHVFLSPGEGNRIQLELFGEDGRLMYRKVFRYHVPPATLVNLFKDIDFEIAGVAETARFVVTTFDSHGRVDALVAEDLILMAEGDSDINPPGDLLSNLVIQQPEPKQLIQGGKVIVSGLVRTTSDNPLLVELIDESGRVVGSRLAAISPSEEGGHRLFAAEVPYQVQKATWVRVTVTERGTRLPGAVYVTTTEALLSP